MSIITDVVRPLLLQMGNKGSQSDVIADTPLAHPRYRRCYQRYAPTYLIAITLMSNSVFACTVPPPHLSQSNDVLVQETDNIVLAHAVNLEGVDKDRGSFTFETVSILKGDPPKRFTLQGFLAKSVPGAPGDFEQHLDPGFWTFDSGNTIQPGDCVAHGIFNVGDTYLIFLRDKSHYRAYENIKSNEDLWLRVIEKLIAYHKEAES